VSDDTAPQTVYSVVGGTPFFEELVERFYEGVAHDEVLRPLYPNQDFTDAKARLCGFLVQYWGGPADYSAARGHPRLRMRHAPFAIGRTQRDAWIANMTIAVDATIENHGFPPVLAEIFHDYFDSASMHLVNVDEAPDRNL
jgi:hemoglobin